MKEGEESRAGAWRSPGRSEIEAWLPHREPFLFLDRIVALEPEATPPALTAEWRVPESADFFRGHYPGNPITPGVILCEHAFQAAAVLLVARGASFGAASHGGGDVPVLARIERAKFRRLVRPGETLTTCITLAETVGPASFLEAKSTVDGATAVELRCVLSKAGGGA